MRRTSVSLPTRNADPHEKPARYSLHRGSSVQRAGTLENIKAAWMTQSQRSRYVKTGGILLFILFLFYYLAPRGSNVHFGGRSAVVGCPYIALSITTLYADAFIVQELMVARRQLTPRLEQRSVPSLAILRSPLFSTLS
jgi:hypothetical protein